MLTCTLRCASAREAMSIAGELRELPGVRIGVHPGPRARGCCDGWLVQLTTPSLPHSAEAPERCRTTIEAAVGRRTATALLGWRPRNEREGARAAATRAHPRRTLDVGATAHTSERETVIASLLRRPSK
jgi:hypothetical protein